MSGYAYPILRPAFPRPQFASAPSLWGIAAACVSLLLAAASGVIGTFLGPAGLAIVLTVALLGLLTAMYGVAVPTVAAFAGCIGALPGVDNSRMLLQGIEVADVAALALIACCVWAMAGRGATVWRSRAVRLLVSLSGLFLCLWCVDLARTVVEGTPLLQALRTGRDFLFFAVLLPLAAAALSEDRLRHRVLMGVAIVAAPTTVAHVAAALGADALVGTIVHSQRDNRPGGLARLDAGTDDLMMAVVSCALAALLARGRASWRKAAFLALLLVGALAVLALIQTRARYVALPLGVLLAMALTAAAPRRWFRGAVVIAAVFLASGLALSQVRSGPIREALSTVSERFVSAAQDASSSSQQSTVEYRRQLSVTLFERLTQESGLVLGLGFRSPTSRYDPALPEGNIRNADVGLLNVLMTMGIVGGISYYGLVLAALLLSLVAARQRIEQGWVAIGALGYGFAAVIGSLTLVTLFSVEGVVTTALVLGAGAAILIREQLGEEPRRLT